MSYSFMLKTIQKLSIKGFHTTLVKNNNFINLVTAHVQSFCDVSKLLSTDCACAVTRFMKFLFLTSEYCMKTFHTQFLIFLA